MNTNGKFLDAPERIGTTKNAFGCSKDADGCSWTLIDVCSRRLLSGYLDWKAKDDFKNSCLNRFSESMKLNL